MFTVVLLVDSDRDNRDVCAGFLSSKGYVAITASTGEEALALAREADVMITETELSGPLDGFDVISAVRRNIATRDLPIITLSGSIVEEVRNQAMHAGANLFLRKPCMLADLLGRIRRLVQVGRPQRRIYV